MYIGKYLVFVVGLSAGVASMFGFSYLSQRDGQMDRATNTASAPAVEVLQPAAPASPFAVAEPTALTSAEPVQVVESQSTDTAALIQRIEDAESRIESLESELAEVRLQQFFPAQGLSEAEQSEALSAVFEPATIAEIQTIRNDLQLQRLELRDRATREGWANSDRFREESQALRSGSQLRDTLGDDAYDKLLAAEGRDNRVRIDSIIENSAADLSGLQTGDLVIRYADSRIFEFRDLRNGTTDGQREESVAVQVSRNGELIDLVIPRGPMGVTLNGVSGQPLSQ